VSKRCTLPCAQIPVVSLRALTCFFLSNLQSVSDFGYALCDIATELSVLVTRTQLPDAVTAHLLDKLSNVEYRLSNGVSEKVQVGALVGAFTIARAMLTPAKN
jgi:hypothetical protein